MKLSLGPCVTVLVLALLATPATWVSAGAAPLAVAARHDGATFAASRKRGSHVGLGKVLSSKFGGQIFNFDVDRSGTDGMLTEAPRFGSAIETFDLVTGKITKVVSKQHAPLESHELVTYGIFANDVGFVDDELVSFRGGKVTRRNAFDVLSPVTGGKITSTWTPPHPKGFIIWWVAENQATTTQAMLEYQQVQTGSGLLQPWLYAANFAANTAKGFQLDANLFGVATIPQIAEDSTTNQAVIALSPDGGRVGGFAPLTILIDLLTGKETQFTGLNNGPFGSGTVNGLAVDSTTHIAATTTELNAQVEFYNLSTGSGVSAQLPGTGGSSQYNSGVTVANDPVNGLFLVAQPISSTTSGGSTIDVFDENGNFVESINGFNFTNANSEVYGYPGLALDPSRRIGWINGPTVTQLQQFTY